MEVYTVLLALKLSHLFYNVSYKISIFCFKQIFANAAKHTYRNTRTHKNAQTLIHTDAHTHLQMQTIDT